MTGYSLTTECKQQFNMCQGLADFTEAIASRAQQWGENFASAIRKTEVAEDVGKNVRTVTRYLNQLTEMGLVSTETKRGRNGGTVVLFNSEALNFTPSNNPITSETKEAREIREAVFPTAPKKVPKRRYRTKMQIAEERALLAQRNDENVRLNNMLEKNPLVKREFFENFDNPTLYYKGYLAAHMYNLYAVVFPKKRYENNKETNEQISKEGLQTMRNAFQYNVLSPRFVGTPVYNKFVELAQFCDEYGINPLSYLTVQFEYAEYLASIGKARVGAIPYVNSLLSDEAKARYYDRENFVAYWRSKGMFGLTNEKVPFVGNAYPITYALYYGYYDNQTKWDQINFLVDRLVNNPWSLKKEALGSYYSLVSKVIELSELTDREKDVLTKFVKQQVSIFAERGNTDPVMYMLAFPLQIATIKGQCIIKKVTKEEHHQYLGNMGRLTHPTVAEFERFEEDGAAIAFSYDGNVSFYNVIHLLGHDWGLVLNPNEVRQAIKKLGEEKIPLDIFGMLDVNRIYKEYIPADELEEENQYEAETITMFKPQ